MNFPDLRTRWEARGYAPEIVESLLDRYGEPHRRYHTAEHLRHALRILDTDPQAVDAACRLSPVDREALELAVWYHDREYDPQRPGNEERSALQFLGDAASLPVSAEVRARVGHLILLSRHHRPDTEDSLGALFCDLDLAVLGESENAYDAYARAVREEYGHVPLAAYRMGRRRVLEGFLQRARLFHCLVDREEPARRNLTREIDSLGRIGWRLPSLTARRSRLEAAIRRGDLPFPDEPRRRRLWLALSELYLDTEISHSDIANAIRATGYRPAEVVSALQNEVGPHLAANLGYGFWPVIGEWAGFDPEHLRTRILERAACPPSDLWRRIHGYLSTWFVWDDLQQVFSQDSKP